MKTERLENGMTRITRGDGSVFEYRSACSPTAEEWAKATAPYDADARLEEAIEDTCRTLLTGGHFFPDGFKWLRDNWGVSFDGVRLHLHPSVFDFARGAAA